MSINIRDKTKPITAEDLIRRYGLENLTTYNKILSNYKEKITATDKILEEFIKATTNNLEKIQNQVDGNITTWFYSGVPTLDNSPAHEWNDDKIKNNHLGDLYYDQDTGYAYRFVLDDEEYKWLKISDSDVAEALALANSAKDTADAKRRTFVDTPAPPYDVGDIWIKNDKDIYRCRTSREEGDYQDSDWVKATDYTNDEYAQSVAGLLTDFKSEVYADYVAKTLLEQTVDSITLFVEQQTSLINDCIKNVTGTGYVKLLNTPNSVAAVGSLVINGFNVKELYLNMVFPSSNTFPSVLTLYTLIFSNEKVVCCDVLPSVNNQAEIYNVGGINGKFYRCVDGSWVEENNLDNVKTVYVNSPIPLRTLTMADGTKVYDEIRFDNNVCNIIQRVGVNNSSMYELSDEIVYKLGEIKLPTFKNDTYLTMKYWTELNYSCEYITENKFTNIFASKSETQALISITDQIDLKVQNKVNKDEVISQINLSRDGAKILAPKISLEGIVTANNNFKVLEDGSIETVNASLSGNIFLPSGGKVIGGDGLLTNLQFLSDNHFKELGFYSIMADETNYKSKLVVDAYVPNDFTIKAANLVLIHVPVKWHDDSSGASFWGKSENIRVYKSTSANNLYFEFMVNSDGAMINEESKSELLNAFSGGSFTAKTPSDANHEMEIVSTVDISSYFSERGSHRLIIESADSIPSYSGNYSTDITNTLSKTGYVIAILNILGYTNFD